MQAHIIYETADALSTCSKAVTSQLGSRLTNHNGP